MPFIDDVAPYSNHRPIFARCGQLCMLLSFHVNTEKQILSVTIDIVTNVLREVNQSATYVWFSNSLEYLTLSGYK